MAIFRGDRGRQRICDKVKPNVIVFQVSKFRWQCPAEMIVKQVKELRERTKPAQLRWNRSCKFVVCDAKLV